VHSFLADLHECVVVLLDITKGVDGQTRDVCYSLLMDKQDAAELHDASLQSNVHDQILFFVMSHIFTVAP
jgi:hypothetical protein